MKNIVYTLALTLFAVSAFGQYDPDALAVLNNMSEKYRKIPAFSADFSQILTNKEVGIEESFEGSISVKDDMYLLQVAGQQIYNDGANVWSYNPELSEVTITPYEPDEQEISLNNIYDLYKDGFKYNLESTKANGDRVVELDPESKNKSYFKIKMLIGGDDGLKEFTVMEKSGNVYTYSIKNFRKRPDLSDTAFTFKPEKYPNVEVIDFR